ncbi:MAG TPA: MtrB/PioB family outer membrane beta-barrel protein [Vicinamibacterales bacterium]|jgi:MtrB/PioB family decaheme-associated outer membrane protein
MRMSCIPAAALLLVLPLAAAAQTAAEETPTGWVGLIDFGVRATNLDGDGARFERYRDLGDGLFLERVRASREAKGWLLDFGGDHVGRRDQRFTASAVDPARLRASFVWDQIPMLLSRSTRSLYSGIGTGVLSIDDALQSQVQATPSAIAPVFAQFGRVFDTKTRRHIGRGSVEYSPTEAVTITTNYRRTNREGTIPFGGSFGHSSLVEIPAPTEHTLSDFDASAEYVRDPVIVRGGYTGSWFHNDVTNVVFDNPFRATDIAATPSRGRLTLAPSNSFIGVNGMVSVKLPRRSRAMAYVSTGMLQDAGDALVPQTINSANTTAPLERQTVEGEARTSSVNLRFTSRPNQFADVTVSYRSYDYDNRTPVFDMTQRVSYDNAPAAVTPPAETEPFGVTRHTFDADFRTTPFGRSTAGVGFTRNSEDRTHRIFEATTDNVFRVTFDTVTRQWFTLRSKYEHAQRRGEGLDETLLTSIGEQSKLRHFDIANRDRDRVTLIGSVTPTGFLNASLTFAAGKDDYLESVFGLRDNTHRVYGAGADYVVNDNASFGVSYSYERYKALQRSRQANPGVQFDDPSRNWAADSTDLTHAVLVNAEILRIAEKLDLRASYDFSRGRARYNYITGPVADRTLPEEVPVPTSLPTPTELPPTLSEFSRGTVDLIYTLTSRVSIGVSYWYDRYRVNDFTLDVDANPELARGQALLMGYLYRPYTANTGWLRLLYHW